ncbi:unnamed protein product [Musa acuminata subsp. malaccensis]|nr:unnamed protein product [Musa acuminata subsp. malaccensis]
MYKRSKEGTRTRERSLMQCATFFGYQARGSLPSKFDCDYAFFLGMFAITLVSMVTWQPLQRSEKPCE